MGRKVGGLLLLLLSASLLAGCWDRVELEDQAYLVTIGIDRAEEGDLMVTALVGLTPELTAGAVQSQSKPEQVRLAAQVLTAQGETITQAMHVLNGSLTRRLDLRQLRGVVVGEELAREGLEPVVMELTRSSWARGNVFIAQARGRAYDVLRGVHPVSEVNPPKMVEGLLLQAKNLHLAPALRMHHFVARHAASGGDPYLPTIAVNPAVTPVVHEPQGEMEGSALAGELPRGGGNPVEFVGTAIYRGDELAGFLTVDQTQMLLALRGEMGKSYITFPDPDHEEQMVTLRFHQENLPKYIATFRGDRPHVEVRILFEGEVLAIPGGTNYVKPEARERLEEAAVKHVRSTMESLLARLRNWEADPVGFGHLYRGRFLNWEAWERFNWDRRLADLTVEVEAEMRIRRYGLVVGPDRVEGR